MFNFKDIPEMLDATDGLAAAVCHFYQNNALSQGSSFKSWKDFINQNPERLR
jgi:crossover junction endodeoxyribonuclease RuvC